MAGYLFTLDNEDSLHEVLSKGVYSTNLKITTSYWKIHHEGTFADYFSMDEGDNVYFFIKRKIYGIGELVNVGDDCKYLNFPKADIPTSPTYNKIKHEMILNDSKLNLNNRVLCTFKSSPEFFKYGIDMDEVLNSNPEAFKMLRVLWKRSFIKIDDKENKALFDIILKSNENSLFDYTKVFPKSVKLHNRIKKLVNEDYQVSAKNLLKLASKNTAITHEMAIEAGVIDYIQKNSTSLFGKWNYLTHQVVASPFKPVDYMDKMDIFGYRFIPSYNTVSKYLVIELKKGKADKDVINQVMKYVDWVNQEYEFKDYLMIEAFVVAYSFPPEVIALKEEVGKRTFARGSRPVVTEQWSNLKLITYKFNPELQKLEFKEV
ncbi:hypothetical protein [Planomicrobium sp. Y74]|uniref:hypothetical protein n=1 Tax=Planomicrobium sp. Y74 TaxID=2478977 RepID=UPI000EF51833|nr:hypothetical protein [Planomicrobium sp. Y74]RLQ90223.1 hypothetical protein D9754_10855 [Planomicrobium sp. Y74]